MSDRVASWLQALPYWLALTIALQKVLGQNQRLTHVAQNALAMTAAAILLLLPIKSLPLGRWLVGINANVSIVFIGVMVIAVSESLFRRSWFDLRDWRTTWIFGAISGLLLYPAALGLSAMDPYALGWQPNALLAGTMLVALGLFWKLCRLGWLLLTAIAGYQCHLLESPNFWDYLVDPVFFLVSIAALARGLDYRKFRQAKS